VEQHSDKLDDHDGKEEEHEDDTDRLKMKVLLVMRTLRMKTWSNMSPYSSAEC
jgi:hypothetical protein